MNRIRSTPLIMLLAAPVIFFTTFFAIPLIVVLIASLSDGISQFTLAQYVKVLADQYHWQVILTTFRIGIVTTAVCFLIGYPLAWYIVRIIRVPAWRRICIILIIVPLFTSNIVRSFGWMVLLGRSGLVNGLLTGSGFVDAPLRFLGTELGIIIGLSYIMLPFMVLAIGNALTQLNLSLEQASGDLGAWPMATFMHITLPLSIPGVVAGSIMVFSMTVSAYVTPALLSGGRVTVLSMLIYQQYSSLFDFHYGGALSIVLLVQTVILVALAGKIGSRRKRKAV